MGQQSLIYSFVARGTVILAEYTEFTGNFTSIASQCLQKLPATNNKFTYNCDGHTFNYLVEDGFSQSSSYTLFFLICFSRFHFFFYPDPIIVFSFRFCQYCHFFFFFFFCVVAIFSRGLDLVVFTDFYCFDLCLLIESSVYCCSMLVNSE